MLVVFLGNYRLLGWLFHHNYLPCSGAAAAASGCCSGGGCCADGGGGGGLFGWCSIVIK